MARGAGKARSRVHTIDIFTVGSMLASDSHHRSSRSDTKECGMDSQRFDALAKVVGRGATRRRVLRGVLGSALAGGAIALTEQGAVQAVLHCREAGKPCQG